MIDIEKITENKFKRYFIIGCSIAMCIGLLICCFTGAVSASDQGGLHDGTYLIYDSSDLVNFAYYVNSDISHITTNAKLMNDIDLTGASFTPIGTSTNMYSGNFDGNGKIINNLYYHGTASNYGLFSYVSGNAIIQNLGLSNVDISSSGDTIGGLIGKGEYQNNNLITVTNCWVSGTISGAYGVGGIVGNSPHITINNCYFNGDVLVQYVEGMAGGIIGISRVCTITNCYVVGTVGDNQRNGGIIGQLVPYRLEVQGDSLISSCVVLATVSGSIDTHKIVGFFSNSYGSGNKLLSYNYAIDGGTSASDDNGLAKTAAEIQASNGIFFKTSSNWGSYQWDFIDTWIWDSQKNLPELKIFIETVTPTITAIAVTSTTPAEIGSTVLVTATLANAPTTDSGTVTFYTSSTPATVSSWVSVGSKQISAQSATGVISHSFTGSSTAGTYYVKAILSDTTQSVTYDSYTDGSITNVFFVLQYADPIPNTPGGPLQPISIPYTITLTASCSNEITVASYVWQLQTGGNWGNVSTGQQYTPTITTPGNHVYRFLAIGKNNHVIPSTSITVNAGYAPSAVITQPTTGTQIEPGQQLNLEATIGGTAGTYTWDFGNGVTSHGTDTGTVDSQSQSITSYVVYNQQKGTREITLTVSNVYGTAAVYKIYIENGKGTLRPAAVSTIKPVDSSGIYNLINDSKPTSYENQMPNLSAMVTDVTKPMTSIIGEWFYLVLFAVPYIILFIRQKNILIPSILGVLFAAWLLVFLPGAAMKAAIGILILCVAGGIIGLYVKRQS